ncbi:MAG: 5-formyltetrahydrofolate cyclo-ligase [Lachnospiraceae bacterium]|nr:5-formyltetrahydrofolate cyclo-ligase [Lachnospiraceae bacterium]
MKDMMCTDKKELRKKLITIRNSLSREEREVYNRSVRERFFSLPQYGKAQVVLIYASYNNEVDTCEIIDKCLKEGKKVACPLCITDNNDNLMDFYFINTREDLICGYKGIMEPDKNKTVKVTKESLKQGILIIPMVGYDREGNRLGYGKGFYDRFISEHDEIGTIGLAYKCQEYPRIPADSFDRSPDVIINEVEYLDFC